MTSSTITDIRGGAGGRQPAAAKPSLYQISIILRISYSWLSAIDFGDSLLVGIVQATDFGDFPLIGIVQTNDFGDCLLIGIVQTMDFGDHPLIGIVWVIGFECCLWNGIV